jgi:hypothetical protein
MAPKTYMDVGHKDREFDFIWIYKEGKIYYRRASAATHETAWGMEAMNYWRGRVEMDTRHISITRPNSQRGAKYAAPSWLLDALEEKFGTGLVIYEFNPGPKRIRG